MPKFKVVGRVRAQFVHVVDAVDKDDALAQAVDDWENCRIEVPPGLDWHDEEVTELPSTEEPP